jgi:hypothetical protein
MMEPEYVTNARFSGLVIRKDYEDLSQWIERARVFYHGSGEISGNPAVIHWKWGGVTKIGHWKDQDTISKYLGSEFQKLLVEEVTQSIGTEKEYRMLWGSLRSSVPGLRPQFFGTTNPGGVGHAWVKRYWVDVSRNKPYTDLVTGKTRIFIPSTVDDNKILLGIDPGYRRVLEGLPDNLRRAWLNGDWDLHEGQFFTDFGPHMRESPFLIRPEDGGRLYGSLDIGIGHYTSFGLWMMDEAFVMHRLLSYKANGFTHSTHAEAIFDRVASFKWSNGMLPVRVWVGHDAWNKSRLNKDTSRAPVDEYIDAFTKGYGDRETARRVFVKANTDRRNGCQVMREVMKTKDGTPGLAYFDAYNTSFEEDIPCAMCDENDPEQYAKKDGAGWDDTCFSGETMVMTDAGAKRIDSLHPGDLVKTSHGLVDCGGAIQTRDSAEMVRLTFENGKSVRVTPDHLFLTSSGKWKKALDFIDETSYIIDEGSYNICKFQSKRRECFIEMFGRRALEPSLKDLTFTTKTEIEQIIFSTISSACLLPIMSAFIESAVIWEIQGHISSKPALLPRNGTEAKRGGNGTQVTSRNLFVLALLNMLQKHAAIAEENIKYAKCFPRFQNTAMPTARPLRCVSVVASGSDPAFCLKLPAVHNFALTSGQVVANCDDTRYGIIGMYTRRSRELQAANKRFGKQFLLPEVDNKLYHSLA